MIDLQLLEKRLDHLRAELKLLLVFPHNCTKYIVWMNVKNGTINGLPVDSNARDMCRQLELPGTNLMGYQHSISDSISLALFQGYGKWYVMEDFNSTVDNVVDVTQLIELT